ncbi:MAG: hypothetical protein WCA17_14115, partial [Burkholderiales bacterium]
VDLARTMAEVARLLAPGGRIIGSEPYTHSALQRIRDSRPVAEWLHPMMTRFIYGPITPYITEDERKLDQRDCALMRARFPALRFDYFMLVSGRLVPGNWARAARLDRRTLRTAGKLGALLGGGIVFSGTAPR